MISKIQTQTPVQPQAPGRYVPPPTKAEIAEFKARTFQDTFKNSTAQAALEGAGNSLKFTLSLVAGITVVDLLSKSTPAFSNLKLLGATLLGTAVIGGVSNAVTKDIQSPNKPAIAATVGFGMGTLAGAALTVVTKNPMMLALGAAGGALSGSLSVGK